MNAGVPLELYGPQYPGGKIFNRAAFTPSAAGQQGNFGRNVLRGFAASQANVAVQRQFQAPGRMRLRFRAEFFNILNQANFGSPTSDLTSPLFGYSTQTLANGLGSGGANGGFSPLYQIGGPRSIQLALRLRILDTVLSDASGMMRAMRRPERRRSLVVIGAALACGLLAWSPPAYALNPALDVSQYIHTAWRLRDGFAASRIVSFAQTADGYLWLGTESGLLRFDGVRLRPLESAGRRIPPRSTHSQPPRYARRHALDWHVGRAGQLEGRHADTVRAACRPLD